MCNAIRIYCTCTTILRTEWRNCRELEPGISGLSVARSDHNTDQLTPAIKFTLMRNIRYVNCVVCFPVL